MNLVRGANTKLVASDGTPPGQLILGLAWEDDGAEYDSCALVLDVEQKILGDEFFLYWNQLVTPDRSVFLLVEGARASSGDRAQVVVDLHHLPSGSARILITLSALVDGTNLASARRIRWRVVDCRTAEVLATYDFVESLTGETCLVVGELYHHQGAWKVRAIGNGHPRGLSDLARTHGVNIP